MKNVSSFVIGILIIHIMLSGLAPTIALANKTTNPDQLSLSINKVEPARKELVLQKEGNQTLARTSLNFEVMRNGMLTENPRKPLDVVFVFDRSGSMNEKVDSKTTRLQRAVEAMKTAATVFEEANKNRGIKDRFGLVLFNDGVEIKKFNGAELTSSISGISSSIENVEAQDGTNYSDALLEAQRLLKKHQDTTRDRYIIFLTDGEPSILETKDLPRGTYYNERYGYIPYSTFQNHKTNYTTYFTVYSNGSSSIYNPSSLFYGNRFSYYGNWVYFMDHAKTYIENHAEDTATRIKTENITLYPVGFGEASKNYLDKLSSRGSNNQSLAVVANGENLNGIFEKLVKDIDTPSFENVQLEVKLPENVNVEESQDIELVSRADGRYAKVKPANGKIQYEVGQAPGLVQIPNLPVIFSRDGTYNFEVTLKYKDIRGTDKIVKYSNEVIITVQDKVAPSFELELAFETDAQVSNDVIKLQKSNVEKENFNSLTLQYFVKPLASLPEGENGTLQNIVVKQVLPPGLKATLGNDMIQKSFPDGSSEITISIQDIAYQPERERVEFSTKEIELSIEVSGEYALRNQPIPSPTIEFIDSSQRNMLKSASVTDRFSEVVDLTIHLIDTVTDPQIEYRGNHLGNLSKYMKKSGQLIGSTVLQGSSTELLLSPIASMEFGNDNENIIIHYANQQTVTMPLVPRMAVKTIENNSTLEKDSSGNYETAKKSKVFFESIVPGSEGAVYEVRTKGPNDNRFTNWNRVNPEEFQFIVEEIGVTEIEIKASGGFIRGTYEERFTVDYKGISDLALQFEEEMYVGDTQTIEAILETTGTLPDIDIRWNSSDNSVASVNNNGVVTAKKTGDVTITASLNGSQLSKQAQIKIIDIPSYTMSFHKPYYYVKVNQPLNSLQGQLRFDPPQLKNKIEVEWSVDLPDKFYIDQDGKGRGISPGVVFVTATSKEDRNISATTMVIIGSGEEEITNPGDNYRW